MSDINILQNDIQHLTTTLQQVLEETRSLAKQVNSFDIITNRVMDKQEALEDRFTEHKKMILQDINQLSHKISNSHCISEPRIKVLEEQLKTTNQRQYSGMAMFLSVILSGCVGAFFTIIMRGSQ